MRYSKIRRANSARSFLILIVALAFALQSHIAQTHIHSQAQDFGGIAKISVSPSSLPGKAPIDKNPVDCPFCQTVDHAGAFVSPAAPLLFLPFVWVRTVALAFPSWAASSLPVQGWRSRAPPPR
jgi:hypothetical protein